MNDTSQLHILEENTLSKKGNFTEAETIRAVKKQSLFVPDVHDLTDVPSKSNVEIYDDFSARIRVLSAAVTVSYSLIIYDLLKPFKKRNVHDAEKKKVYRLVSHKVNFLKFCSRKSFV